MTSNKIAAKLIVLTFVLAAPNAVFAANYKVTILPQYGFDTTFAAAALGDQLIGAGRGPAPSDPTHALLWNTTTNSFVDLHPAGFDSSLGTDITETYQIGHGQMGSSVRALLWTGTPESVVDLTPAGYQNSLALGASGNTQVGGAEAPSGMRFDQHAMLWSGSAASALNLHPAGYFASTAWGVSGGNQVGQGIGPNGPEALLWHGTAESVVSLQPSLGYSGSCAFGTSSDSQVGYGTVASVAQPDHALLWHGTASSFVDLNPVGFDTSIAFDVDGDYQVGIASIGTFPDSIQHAMLWSGSAASAVDLHAYLASTGMDFDGSTAHGVEADGTIVGSAFQRVGTTGNQVREYAVIWTPVPEPTGFAVGFCALLGVAAWRCLQ